MNKVIEGKRYDTETAKFLGAAYSDLSPTDFGYWEEELYRTKSGNYFLHGVGGPMSQYAVHAGNSSSGGAVIKPYSMAQAQRWAEDNLTADEYESIFGEVDGEKVKISADISPAAKEALDKMKHSKMKSNGDVIEYLLTLVEKNNG